jgi:hypothetical protein
MGIVSHYVCDYFCYSHSPSFRGNLWDHIKYEWIQRMPAPETVAFFSQEVHGTGFNPLMDVLDKYIGNHDRELVWNVAASKTDIAMGTAAAGWLAEAVFCSAENSFPVLAAYPLTGADYS